MMHTEWIYLIAAFSGLVIGSFLNVVIYRYPKIMERQWKAAAEDYLEKAITFTTRVFHLTWPRSHCPQCENALKPWHNVPLLSYALLKAHCAFCGKRISPIYPLVEALTCILLVSAVYRFGISEQTVGACVLISFLIVLGFIDANTQLLPDDIVYVGLWTGLIANTLALFTSPVSAIMGAAAGYSVLWALAHAYKVIRKKDGMGYGDFKLFALLGAWFGMEALPTLLLIAALSGLGMAGIQWARGRLTAAQPMAFGPALAISGVVVLFFT